MPSWRSLTKRILKAALRRLPQQTIDRFSIRCQGWFCVPPIIVYQMGKVGSSSVYEALKNSRFFPTVFHVHHLDMSNIAFAREEYAKFGLANDIRTRHLWVGEYLGQRLGSNRCSNLRVVTGVREPIARAVSELFQVANWKYPHLWRNGNINVQAVVSHLLQDIEQPNGLIRFGSRWFEEEFERTLGVDVLATSFDMDRGYTRIDQDDLEILVYQMEKLDQLFDDGALEEFARRPLSGRLVNANVGAEKRYAQTYKQVCQTLRFPPEACRELYASQFVRHFYDENMIEGFIRRWSSE